MSEKTVHITLAYSEENCEHKNFRLNKLPVSPNSIKQLFSEWYNTFKYFQDKSHVYNKWEIKGSRERMTKTAISQRGKLNAC
jgi:hypothetical protein